jgi:hypothetical protein
VAELVDALDSKSCTFGCAGSIPARGTKKQCEKQSESDVGNTAFFLHSVSLSLLLGKSDGLYDFLILFVEKSR